MSKIVKKADVEFGGLVQLITDDDVGGTLSVPSVGCVLNWKEINNRRLVINEDVTQELMYYSKLIIQWNAEDKGKPIEDRTPIKILLNSYGGDVDACWSFCRVIETSKTPIHIVNMGICASAGAIIFLSGHKRYAMPGSRFLIHLGEAGVQGHATQVIESIKEYEKELAEMGNYIIQRTEIDKKLYDKNKKKEWWISADEALKLKVTDEIVTDFDVLYN